MYLWYIYVYTYIYDMYMHICIYIYIYIYIYIKLCAEVGVEEGKNAHRERFHFASTTLRSLDLRYSVYLRY